MYAEALAGQLKNSIEFGGSLHNSYYDTLLQSMFEGATDELLFVYYHRQLTDWLANNVIRGAFSDEFLANLTEGEMVALAVTLSVAIGIGIFLAPMAVAEAAVIGFVTGVAGDVVSQVAENIDAGRDPFALDMGRALNAGFRGAVLGAATGALGAAGQGVLGVAKAFLNPALQNVLCKTVTLAYNGYQKYQSAQQLVVAYDQFQKGEYAQALLSARGGISGLMARGSSFCFIAGTLVVRKRYHKRLASEQFVAAAPPVSADWGANSSVLLTTAGVLLAVGAGGYVLIEQKSKKKTAEEIQREAMEAVCEEDRGLVWEPDLEAEPAMKTDLDLDRLCDDLFHLTEELDNQGTSFAKSVSTTSSTTLAPSRLRVKRTQIAPLPRAIAAPPKPRSYALAWLASFLLLAAGIASTALPGDWLGLGGPAPNFNSTGALNLTGSSGDWNDETDAGEDFEEEYLTTPIEELKQGDLVLAMNLETGEVEERPIVGVMVRTSHKLRVMQVEATDGSTQEFRTTDEHPFFVIEAKDFVSAGEIALGQHFLAPDGIASTLVSSLTSSTVALHPEGVQVYNFEVSQAHNYFVLERLDSTPFLVHNGSTLSILATGFGESARFLTLIES